MSELVRLGGAKLPSVALPHSVELPTRYYGRVAVADLAREFAEVADIACAVGDGVIRVTFTRIDGEPFEHFKVIGEFLNQALYASALEATG